jgi:CubicO group peptidase (beta-lactamase class C family)
VVAAQLIVLAAALTGEPAVVAEIRALQRERLIPAVGLVVVAPPAEPYIAAWGRTGDPERPDAGVDTVFRLGSITKTFTALALAAAVADRGSSLESPLDSVVGPGSHENRFADRPVRLRHLVEHTAGFTDLTAAEFDFAGARPPTLADALALDPRSRRVQWSPGTRSSYTNVGPGLSALAIEHLTGQTFEAFTTCTVLQPLGMPLASFFPVADMARGFKAGGTEEIPYWNMTFRAYGALNASVSEMGRFVATMLAGGVRDGTRVIPERSFAELRRPRTTLAADAGLGIGYGLGMYGWVSHGHVFWGHGGDADGFRSRYGLLPNAGRGYFVVINADDPRALARMQRLIEAWLVADLTPSSPPPRVNLDAAALGRWEGEYYPSSTRFRFDAWRAGRLSRARVTRVGKSLEFRKETQVTRLVPVSPHLFRREGDPVPTVAFMDVPIGGTGRPCKHLQGELGNFVRVEAGSDEDSQMRCIRE